MEAMANREEICEYTKCTINDMTNKTAWHLAKNYETVRKGVKDIMGGKVLEYEAKTILNRGREEGRLAGRAEGREEGRLAGRAEGKILTVRIFQVAKKNPEFTCNQIAEEHFLKCEEGGYLEMCEVSEKIYNEGIIEGKKEGKKEGIIEGKRETAFNMKNKGYSDATIADILDVGINVIQQWLSGNIVKS